MKTMRKYSCPNCEYHGRFKIRRFIRSPFRMFGDFTNCLICPDCGFTIYKLNMTTFITSGIVFGAFLYVLIMVYREDPERAQAFLKEMYNDIKGIYKDIREAAQSQ